MKISRRALVSGASVAGPALAWWLERAGWRVEVVERASQLRTGGQNVDVRGAARGVVRAMGLEDRLLAAGTGEVGIRFVDGAGRSLAEFPAGEGDSGGATAEAEVLRGRLAQLLVGACGDGVRWRWGDTIAALDQRPAGRDHEGVEVTFASGDRATYDLVVAADGGRSRTRDLVPGTDARLRPLGVTIAYGTVPPAADDDRWWRWYVAPGGRNVTLRPDGEGTTRAALAFAADPDGPAGLRLADLDDDGRLDLLRRRFTGAGWESERVLAGLAADPELYVEHLAQVRAARWTSGAVALLGDAAWAVTPLAGQGTSLAIAGAQVLVGEVEAALAAGGTVAEGLVAYERVMRPVVEDVQDLPPGVPRLAYPRSRVAVAAARTALRVAGSRPARRLAGLLPGGDDGPAWEVPDYPALTRPAGGAPT